MLAGTVVVQQWAHCRALVDCIAEPSGLSPPQKGYWGPEPWPFRRTEWMLRKFFAQMGYPTVNLANLAIWVADLCSDASGAETSGDTDDAIDELCWVYGLSLIHI